MQAVTAEVIYVFIKLYKIDKRQVVNAVEELLSNKNMKVQDKDVVADALSIFKDKNLDFVDCLLCAYFKQIKIFSFDKKLNKYKQDL